MDNGIRKARYSDVDGLTRTYVRAYDDDPVVNWIVRQDERRAHALKLFFRTCLLTFGMPHQEVYVTDDSSGGALWIPPGKSKISIIRQAPLLPKMIQVARPWGIIRLLQTVDIFNRMHPKKEHYYLQFIGVDPLHQGKGIGGALLLPVIDLCNRHGYGMYLENSKEANLAFYQRHGFNVIRVIGLGRGSPPVWLMWREARPYH
jgi:ribosomal protein S18 acetylase RimI-like enzyme